MEFIETFCVYIVVIDLPLTPRRVKATPSNVFVHNLHTYSVYVTHAHSNSAQRLVIKMGSVFGSHTLCPLIA